MEENLVHSKLSPLKQEITQTHNQIASSHSLQLGSPRFISISANDYTNWGFPCLSSIPQENFLDNTSNETLATSYEIPSSQPIILFYTIRVTEMVTKYTTSKL